VRGERINGVKAADKLRNKGAEKMNE